MIRKSHDKKNPEGAVLLFALVVMMLMGLMATAIFLNTRSEMNISRNTNLGRDAFAKADSAARLALFLARPVAEQGGGWPEDSLTDKRGPFTVELRNFNWDSMANLAGDGTETDIRDRYLAAAAVQNPHLIVRHNGRIVATAVVAISGGGIMPGPGEGGMEDFNPNEGGQPEEVFLTITATGRVPLGGDGAASDYYSGNADSPHSVVTTIYKVLR